MSDEQQDPYEKANAAEFLAYHKNNVPRNPVFLRRTFLLLFRNFFSSPEQYQYVTPDFRKFRYSEDASLRTLEVWLEQAYDPDRPQVIPGVFVGTDTTQFSKNMTGDLSSEDTGRGSVTRTVSAVTPLRVAVRSGSSDEVLKIQTLITSYLLGFSHQLRQCIPLNGLDLRHTTRPVLEEDAAETRFIGEVFCDLSYDYSAAVSEESHRLRNFSFNFDADVEESSRH